MKRFVWFVGAPLVALITGVAGSMPVYVMGLVVPIFILGPLALVVGSLLATLSAGWVANFSTRGVFVRTRSRLWMIFAVALVASLMGLLAGLGGTFLVDEFGVGGSSVSYTAVVYLPGALISSSATALAAWRLRSPAEDELDNPTKAALVLAAAWLVFLILTGSLSIVGSGYLPQDVAGLIAELEFAILFIGGFILAVSEVFLATRFSRGSRKHSLQWDAALSLASFGLLPFAIVGTIFLGCSLTYWGA